MTRPSDPISDPLNYMSDREIVQRKDFDPLTTRAPNRPGIGAPDMVLLIDHLLERHSPKAEPFDPATPRAIQCQIVVGSMPLAGVLSETYYNGVYRMICQAQRNDRTIAMVEYFFTHAAISNIAVERPDLTELAKKTTSDVAGAGKIWTPPR
jgi:hypothetical protein